MIVSIGPPAFEVHRIDVLDDQLVSTQDACLRLRFATQTLDQVADAQALATSWMSHVGNVLVNGGLGLGLGLGFDRWRSAFILGVGGTAVGEVMTLTRPRGAMSARGVSFGPMGLGGVVSGSF